MKRVAIIGPDFAPSSLPPALRIRYFAQHLPEFGWQPIVITTDPQYYEGKTDPENERLLASSLEVIRTRAFPAKWTRRIGVGDLGMRSVWHHWRVLSRLCRERKVDLVFLPVPPYVQMVLGRLAYERYGVPYVVDYIDPWVTEFYWALPKEQRPPKWAMSYTLSRMLEPFSLKRVRHLVGVSSGTTDSVIVRYPWLSKDNATEIPYGGESADFDYLRENPRKNQIFDPHDGLLHVCYTGAYTISMRETMRALLSAVRSGLERMPELFERLRLHFVGTSYDPKAGKNRPLLAMARELGIESLVDEHPDRISYLDALQTLLDAHALIIIGSSEPHYTASKIFPYILARKPLLTVFHEASSVVTILKETQAGDVITFNSQFTPGDKVDEISRRLERILLLPQNYQPPTCWEAFEPYTTRAMAARLAQVFDEKLIVREANVSAYSSVVE